MLLLTEGLEIHDEALVAAETKSIVEVVGVDIGIFIKGDVPTREEVEEAVRRGSEMLPLQFLPTERSHAVSLLCYKLPNGEDVNCDWLVWIKSKQALFCLLSLPALYLVFHCESSFISTGYSKDNKWKKLLT